MEKKYSRWYNTIFPFSNHSGFTLIELLLVIAVISILVVTVSVALNPFEQLRKANDGRRKSDLSQLQKALELYYQDNNSYPVATATNEIDWGGAGNSQYIPTIPKDPLRGQQYIYRPVAPDGYVIFAGLERGDKDPQACNATGKTCNLHGVDANSCGTYVCNFGVSSPNVSTVN
jgi:general secretion pathway protein G